MKKGILYFKILKHILRDAIKNFPMNYFVMVISSLMMSVGFVLQADIEKKLFDSAYIFISDIGLNNIFFYFVQFVLIYIFTQIMIHISNCAEEIIDFKLQKKLSKEICMKASYVSAEYFEDSNFLDSIEKSITGKESAVNIVLCTSSLVFYYIPYILFMSFWLWKQSPILVFAILLTFIPTVVAYAVQVEVFAKNEDNVAPLRRKSKVYEDSIIGKGHVKETRILGGFNFFMLKYNEVLNQITEFDFNVRKKRQRLNVILKVIQSVSFISIILISLYLAVKGKISVGSFAAVFSSIDILFTNMDEAISRQYGTISESFGTVENYYKFIKTGNFVKEKCEKGLITKVENVSFTYPNSDVEALTNINFEIKPGERIAVVGENGAGKSTLAKILLGIYNPSSGKVYRTTNISKKYTAVFQNYMKYSMSLKDNIVLSNKDSSYDLDDLKMSLSKAGLDIDKEKFFNGLDTILGKEFGGIELSGGEWQKLAIARGMFREFDFIVFDEPTSAIDPFEESNLYDRINKLTRDKTTVIITHRMASVKFADRIFVLKQGELIEVGTHQELINLEGQYARLYKSQKDNYATNL